MRTRTHTAEETEELGARLARARPAPAAALAVVYLRGELGSGKTTFARGFARASGVTGLVRSPTYTLLELHGGATGTLVHLDLYRVQTPAELDSIGLREWAAPKHVWLIEWPERGGGGLPAPDLKVSFSAGSSGYELELSSASALGSSWLVQLEGASRSRSS